MKTKDQKGQEKGQEKYLSAKKNAEQEVSKDSDPTTRLLTDQEIFVRLGEENIPKKYYNADTTKLKNEQRKQINDVILNYFEDKNAQLIVIESKDADKQFELAVGWLKALFKHRIGYPGFLDLQQFPRILEQHREKIIYLENFTRKKILDSRDILFISNFATTILERNDQRDFHAQLLNIYQKRGILVFLTNEAETILLSEYLKDHLNIYSIKGISNPGKEKTSIFKEIEVVEA